MNDDSRPDELEQAIEALEQAGSVPPSEAWETLVDWEGNGVTRALIDVMRDGGDPAIHAVRILAEREDAAGLDPMIEMLVHGDVEKLLRDEITFACRAFGEAALDPLLEAYDNARDFDHREAMSTLLEAAWETGAETRRLSEVLATHVAYEPAKVRRMLTEYDSTDEVTAILEERAAAIPEMPDDARPDGDTIQAIWNTIEQLGGSVPESLRREIGPSTESLEGITTGAEAYIKGAAGDPPSEDDEAASNLLPELERLADHSESDTGDHTTNGTPRNETDVGRNDPCPCGSGRKYKQCCGRTR